VIDWTTTLMDSLRVLNNLEEKLMTEISITPQAVKEKRLSIWSWSCKQFIGKVNGLKARDNSE